MKYYKCFTVEQVVQVLENLNLEINPSINFEKIKTDVPVYSNTFWSGWNFTSEALQNTLLYCVEKLALQSEIHIIHEGKLHTLIQIRPKYTAKEYLPYLRRLNKNLKFPYTFYEGTGKITLDHHSYKEQNKFRFMNCVIKSIADEPESGENTKLGKYFNTISEKYQLPDGIYFLAASDVPILKKDGTEPWDNVVGGEIPLLSHKYNTFIPILNMHTGLKYLEIPLPNYDDLDLIKDFESETKDFELNWSKKINKAMFRGSGTGCGFTIKTNPRFKAAALSQKYPSLLDAGIVKMHNKFKFNQYEGVGYSTFKTVGLEKAEKVPFAEQTKYKYILHIDGNVAAYRLSKALFTKSVILLVESDTRLWFQQDSIFKPWVHYIPVRKDLSNLIPIIQWCRENDEECEKIAENAYELGNKIINFDSLARYTVATLQSLHK